MRDTSRVLVRFGNRVKVADLDVAPSAVPLTLGAGEGLDAVYASPSPGIT